MKMLRLKNAKGFTLLEILIVLVILAVLAGLMVPAYTTSIEKSRSQEALQSIAAMRDSAMRYFALNNTYVGMTPATLDFNPNTAVGGATPLFTYTVQAAAAGTFTLRARRIALAATDFVEINEAGTIVKSGVYA